VIATVIAAADCALRLATAQVEPTFIEESAAASAAAGAEAGAEVDASGFPIPLTKRQRRNTVEPRYLGEKKVKAWVAPEYAIRRKSKKLRQLRNKVRL
jgi:hypothetical protein